VEEMEEIEVADYLYLTRFGAAYLEDIGAVVVSDIHLGYEEVLAKNGIFLPRVQSDIIYNTVEEIMDKYNPSKFIINGDLKHEFSKNTPQEWQDVYKLLEIISKRSEAIVVKGNHDNYVANIASKLNIKVYDKYQEGRYVFHHGHKRFRWKEFAIIGNEHPSVGLRDSVGSVVKIPCFLFFKDKKLIVLPALSIFAGGSDMLKSDIMSPVLKGVDINSARVYGLWEPYGIIDLGNLGDLL
jgi:putative phosphoesterase, SbcD/Mre11-related